MASKITLKGFDQYLDRVRRAAVDIPAIVDAEVSASAINVERNAKQRAPVDLGNLRATINHHKVKDCVWEVRVSAEYAAYIEFGTRSQVSIPAGWEEYAAQFKGATGQTNAKEMIYEWCRRQGIPKERWYWIYVSIMIKGIKPQPFLVPSIKEEEPKLIENIKNALNNL